MFQIKFLIVLLFLSSGILNAQDVLRTSEYDSVLKLRYLAENSSDDLKTRLGYAKKAVKISNKLKVDSIILKSNRVLSFAHLLNGNYETFKKINDKNLPLAKKLNDSLAIGVAFQNLGWYHYQSRIQNDSAYFYLSNAIEIYHILGEESRQVSTLTNMVDVLEVEKDYVGAEEAAIKGLTLLAKLPETEANKSTAWNFNNLLGIISLKLNRYDDSLEYHDRAIEIANSMDNGYYKSLTSLHNQAFVYRKKYDYERAIKIYADLLKEDKLFKMDETFYPLILDNLAFTRYENGDKNYSELERMFKEAYRTSDSLDDQITKLAISIDLAKFYQGQNNQDSARFYGNKAYQLAKETTSNDILLESLVVMSEITPGDEGKKYLKEHIKLNDSLLDHERAFRNKSARIQFETDQIEMENQRISQQRFWLLMVSIVLIVSIFLLYIIITQRAKNKELTFKQDQQKANEEIYNLMLSQQDKVDEARANEKKRISEELHDGILGRLFGTRLSLDSLNFNSDTDAVKTRAQYINDLKMIEQDIRQISHDLNTDFVSGSGFVDIIETLIENQSQAYQFTYDFYHTDDINWENISNKTKIHIYRILQESLQNIYKHAHATHVKISFHLKNNVIWFAISDNGKGFDINKSKKGIGLKNINSRVAEVDGSVDFESQPDSGTKITIKIPYINH